MELTDDEIIAILNELNEDNIRPLLRYGMVSTHMGQYMEVHKVYSEAKRRGLLWGSPKYITKQIRSEYEKKVHKKKR